MAYQVPETNDKRREELMRCFKEYSDEYEIFKTRNKKAAGSRAKKALTVVKKLITNVRRDIQEEIDAVKKQAKAAE